MAGNEIMQMFKAILGIEDNLTRLFFGALRQHITGHPVKGKKPQYALKLIKYQKGNNLKNLCVVIKLTDCKAMIKDGKI